MKIIAYSRVSTEEQAKDGHNVDLWPKKFEQYCKVFDHELVHVEIDRGVSGGTLFEKRTGGKIVLGMLGDDMADAILVPDLDRIFRVTRDGLHIVEDVLAPISKALISVNDHIDTSTPIGKFMFTINLARCQLEREKVCQRTFETMQGLKAAGQVYGHVPFGLIAVGRVKATKTRKGSPGKLFKDPEKWAIRQGLFELREAGMSYRAIAEELWRDRTPAPNGGKRWPISTLTNIFNSEHDFDHIPDLPDSTDTVVSMVSGKQVAV